MLGVWWVEAGIADFSEDCTEVHHVGVYIDSTTMTTPLPEYENPPLTEVVCGVLFNPLEELKIPYIGLFWEQFRSQFPNTVEVEPIVPVVEKYDDAGPVNDRDFDFAPRIWFVSEDNTRLIQLQKNRFHYNWRKYIPSDEYPRYGVVMSEFREYFAAFLEFLNKNNIGTVQPIQYEITYINHIPLGQGWHSLEDVGRVFPCLSKIDNGSGFLPASDNFNLRKSYPFPNREGRLHFSVRSAARTDTGEQILLVELTARGIPKDLTWDSKVSWFDRSREWIVRGFTDLTDNDIQQTYWRRTI